MMEDEATAAVKRHVEVLAGDIGPRAPFLGDGLRRAAAYIGSQLEAAGLQVAEQGYEWRGERVVNLVATPPGPAGAATPYYVIGAHYDTVPSSPGADDNASAVAVLLELARRLAAAAPAPPVRFVAFTLEEPPAFMTGGQGSRMFVRSAGAAGETIAGAVILEMVGFTSPRQHYPIVLRWAGYPEHGRFIGVVGNRRSRAFGRAVVNGFRRNERLPVEHLFVPFNGWVLPATRLSDHATFWDAGLPAVMVTDTAFFRNPHYHLPSDRPDTLDYPFMAELVRSLELAVVELSSALPRR